MERDDQPPAWDEPPAAVATFDGVRRRLAVCGVAGLIGLVVAAIAALSTYRAEHNRIESSLFAQSLRLVQTIEKRLEDNADPLVALAAVLETEPTVTEEQFRTIARKLERLGAPIGRLGWSPLVLGREREAFEAEARATGIPDYTISRLTPDWRVMPAEPADQYFPIRLEATSPGFRSAMGLDILADPTRRRAADLARDTGQPVALLPSLMRSPASSGVTYLTYVPLYDEGPHPTSLVGRRHRLSAYLSATTELDDVVADLVSAMPTRDEVIVFRLATPGHRHREEINFLVQPGQAPVPVLDKAALPTLQGMHFTHSLMVLGLRWTVVIAYPNATLLQRPATLAWAVGALGLLGTAAVMALLNSAMRQAERDRHQRLGAEERVGELGDANRVLSETNAALRDREQASQALAHERTRFLATASHDLRQPLHALTLFTSALSRRVSDPVSVELVGHIRELGHSLKGMFDSLLDLSRLDAGAVKARIGAARMDELMRNLHAEMAPQAQEKGLRLRMAGRFPPAQTDPALLEAILRNLVGNAIKFTDRGGVLIAGRRRAGQVVIEVWDTGHGIPADQQELIFGEFERLEADTAKPGIGLGLSIVRRLCGLIDARLTVCSRPGQGSRFAVSLPPAQQEPVASVPEIPDLCPRTILAVDDDPAVLAALARELTDHGHVVHTAATAVEARALITGTVALDVALMDLRLHGRVEGWALAEDWARARPGCPVILTTGSTNPETLRRVRESGLPTLFKPVLVHTLLATIADPSTAVRDQRLSPS